MGGAVGKKDLDAAIVLPMGDFSERAAFKNRLNADALFFDKTGKMLKNLNLIARPQSFAVAAGQLRGIDDVDLAGPTASRKKRLNCVKNAHEYSCTLWLSH